LVLEEKYSTTSRHWMLQDSSQLFKPTKSMVVAEKQQQISQALDGKTILG